MSDNKNVPSEFRISEKWDKCIENFTLHFAAGLVAGGLTSVVLARSGAGRGVLTGFGAGAGAGSSWTTCQLAFKGDSDAQAALDKSDKLVDEIKEKINRA
uniref:MICOS complex subunit MIC10 n=1 Tax=Globisporangium ultimum (strain ATCC 200006 / CBS 805.95 / DAOM BR144) TaxID=431595 RepID=K3X912_GLOUD